MNTLDPVARREGLKLFFDAFKHLTTLSSGSIVVLVTVVGKIGSVPLVGEIGSVPQWKGLVTLSLVSFLISIVGSIIVMLSTARTIRRNDTTDQLPDKLGGTYGYLIAVIGFALGLGFLALFGMLNL